MRAEIVAHGHPIHLAGDLKFVIVGWPHSVNRGVLETKGTRHSKARAGIHEPVCPWDTGPLSGKPQLRESFRLCWRRGKQQVWPQFGEALGSIHLVLPLVDVEHQRPSYLERRCRGRHPSKLTRPANPLSMKGKMAKRKNSAGVDVDQLLRERLKELGALGGKAGAKKVSKDERAEKAKKAAAARWSKKRKT
jgi:hypothetical protein